MRKRISIMLAVFTVIHTLLSLYKLPVNAAAVAPVMGPALYETYCTLYGYTNGFGNSIIGMNGDITADQMRSLFANELNGVGNTWNNTDISGISDKNVFLTFLQNSLNAIIKHNTGLETKDLYDALNQRSYSASGTVATKTIENILSDSILRFSEMTPEQFENLMTMTMLGFTEDSVSNYDAVASYMLFEALQSGLIATTSYDRSSEFYEDVADSVFDYSTLYKSSFAFEGQVYNIFQMNKFDFYFGANQYKYIFDDYVYIVPVLVGNQVLFYVFNEKEFSFTLNHYIRGDLYNIYNYSSNLQHGIYNNCDTGGVFFEGSNILFEPVSSFDVNLKSSFVSYISEIITTNFLGKDFYLDEEKPIDEVNPTLKIAKDAFFLKDISVSSIMDLAQTIAEMAPSSVGKEDSLDEIATLINGLTVTLPDVVDGKNDVVQAVEGVGEAILTLPRAIWLEFEGTLEAIKTKALTTTRPWEDGENQNNSLDITNIFSGIILLLLIVFVLLRIFLHCMIFIINVFRIPARPAFLPDEMIMGLEYLNTLEIPGIGLSVYAFMMGLIYILIMFYAIGVLRKSVDRVKLPKS